MDEKRPASAAALSTHVLAQPEILAGRPERLDVRPHRAQVRAHRSYARRVCGDRSRCRPWRRPAERTRPPGRSAAASFMVMPRASPRTSSSVQPVPHPQAPAGHTAHEPVDDQEALAAGDMVGPGERMRGGHGTPRGRLSRWCEGEQRVPSGSRTASRISTESWSGSKPGRPSLSTRAGPLAAGRSGRAGGSDARGRRREVAPGRKSGPCRGRGAQARTTDIAS